MATKRLLLIINILICLYFILLVVLGNFQVNIQWFRILGELITIPMLLCLAGITVYAFIQWQRIRFEVLTVVGFTFYAGMITMILLVLASIFMD